MPVFVKVVVAGMRSDTKLVVQAKDRISDVKRKILDTLGLPPHLQRLSYAGKELVDARTLLDYGIQKESTLVMVLNLSGGMNKGTLEVNSYVERLTTKLVFKKKGPTALTFALIFDAALHEKTNNKARRLLSLLTHALPLALNLSRHFAPSTSGEGRPLTVAAAPPPGVPWATCPASSCAPYW